MRGATSNGFLSNLFNLISIHAPHAGRDALILGTALHTGIISIHAPHAGRDPPPMMICWIIPYFNPRAPCGARPGL